MFFPASAIAATLIEKKCNTLSTQLVFLIIFKSEGQSRPLLETLHLEWPKFYKYILLNMKYVLLKYIVFNILNIWARSRRIDIYSIAYFFMYHRHSCRNR